jgi:UTRA domain
VTDQALILRARPEGSRTRAATLRPISSSSVTAWVSAARRLSLASRQVRMEATWPQHLPIAQQRRLASGRLASLPCAQHWQVRHGIDRYSRERWLTGGQAILIAEAADQGWSAGQRLRFLGEVTAPEEAASRLGVATGTPVWVRRRTTLINERPNQLADSYFERSVADAAPKLKEEDTGPGGGFARLEEAGYRLARIREELTTRMPVGPEIVALQLPEGTPVIELIRTTYDTDNRPVEVMVSVIAGDMATFCYDFPIPD